MKSRKIILAVCISFVLILGGCQTIKTALNAVENMLCAPTDVQKAQAQAAKMFIGAAISFGAAVADIAITSDQAVAVMDKVQAGVCVALTDLAGALDYIDDLNTSVQQTKGLKAKAMPPELPDLSALRAAVK